MFDLQEIIGPLVDVLDANEGRAIRKVADMGKSHLVNVLTQIKNNHSDPEAVTKATEALGELGE